MGVESSASTESNESTYNPKLLLLLIGYKFETVKNNDRPAPRTDQRVVESQAKEIPVEENIVEREHVPLPKKKGMRKAK